MELGQKLEFTWNQWQNEFSRRLGAVLSCDWRYLAFLNYAVEREQLESLLPLDVELDLWDGKPWITLVALACKNARAFGVPLPAQQDHELIQMRLYIKRKREGRTERGVVLLKEINSNPIFSFFARLLYHEPYSASETHRKIRLSQKHIHFSYTWGKGDELNQIEGETVEELTPVAAGSFEDFITQRPWYAIYHTTGKVSDLHVEHPIWSVAHAKVALPRLHESSLLDPRLANLFSSSPTNAFLADGSEVKISLTDKTPLDARNCY